MAKSSRNRALDPQKWFDRLQPQTLQTATWLLYLNGFFAFIGFWGQDDWIGFARVEKGVLGFVIGLLVIISYIGGGFLMANDRRLGYRIALLAAFSPFVLRLWILWSFSGTFFAKVTGNNTISFIFEAAVCALLLHPHSREHQRVWYS